MIRPLLVISAAALALAACQRDEERPPVTPEQIERSQEAAVAADGADARAEGGVAAAEAEARARDGTSAGAAGGEASSGGGSSDTGGGASNGNRGQGSAASGVSAGEAVPQELARPDTPMPQTDPDGRPSL